MRSLKEEDIYAIEAGISVLFRIFFVLHLLVLGLLVPFEFNITSAFGKGCPEGSEMVSQTEREEDDRIIIDVECKCLPGRVLINNKCEIMAFPLSAAELVNALDKISDRSIFFTGENDDKGKAKKGPLPRGKPIDSSGKPINRKLADNNCQTFFRALGDELAKRGLKSWSDFFPLNRIGDPDADGIVSKIEKIAKEKGEWKSISEEKAQEMANKGAIVIGGVRADPKKGRKQGHIVVVFPMPPGMDLSKFNEEKVGHGPFVRDGNEHFYEFKDPETREKTGETRFHPSTRGAVRASRATPLNDTAWYIWDPHK